MIKQGLKNYFKNLKYIFNPLGTIALGFVFGLSIFIPLFTSSVNELIEEIKNIFQNANIDLNQLKDSIVNIFQSLNWSNPIETLKQILNEEWLTKMLESCLSSFVDSMDVYMIPLKVAINTFCNQMIGGIVAIISFVLLGVIGGYFLIKCLVRRNIAKRTFRKYLLANILDTLFSVLIIVICAWLFMLWKYSIFISLIFAFILFGGIALSEAYFVHGRHKLSRKEIVNIKNIGKLLLTNMLILLIAGTFVLICVFLINIFVGIFIGISLMQIAFVVISLNAESYVIKLLETKEEN